MKNASTIFKVFQKVLKIAAIIGNLAVRAD
jgi:hypothetical protein